MARTAKARERPANYPKLTDYQPTRFMLPDSHYDEAKADRAVRFIENLCHTKGRWAGKPFWLLPWQEQIIRDIFGVVKEDDTRQFRTAYVEIRRKTENRSSRRQLHCICFTPITSHPPKSTVLPLTGSRLPSFLTLQSAWWK